MKKQKKEKVVPTQEQLDKMVSDYLKNSEKHLFQVKYFYEEKFPEEYYKVMPIELNDEHKHYCMKITFSKSSVKVDFYRVDWINTKKGLGMMKDEVFLQYKKHKSVKQGKKIREKFEQIKNYINSPVSEGGPRPGKSEIEAEIKRILSNED